MEVTDEYRPSTLGDTSLKVGAVSHYKSNIRDIEFNLFEVFGRDRVLGTGPFAEVDADTAREVLAEVDRLAREDLAASFTDADRNPPVFDPATHTAPLPESFKKSYQAWMDAEFWRLTTFAELGGTPAPSSVCWAMGELVLGANPAIWMYGAGPMFAGVLHRNGNERDRKIAQLVVDKGWNTTMVLTEPDAGSDVGAGRSKATQNADGTWNIEGVKRFITSAEGDLSDNIIHMVLARPVGVEGAGGPGTKGLSLFIVPKFHFDLETGELGERNGAYVTNVEHKMGIKVSNTCELTFGDPQVGGGEPAVGYLLGEVHNGIAQMFQVIENARMMVGTKAIATLSTGYLNALEFAKERVQGADLAQSADKTAPRVTITHHPDVRRSLMTQKSYAEAMRSLVLYTATWKDQGAALGHLAGEIQSFIASEAGNGRLKVERELLATALDDAQAIVGHMINDLMSAQEDTRNIYKVGLNTSRLLMVLGDVVCSWLLLRQAEVALEKLGGDPGKDKSFYEGKVAAAQFFAQQVLPKIAAERAIAESTDLALMDLDESAF